MTQIKSNNDSRRKMYLLDRRCRWLAFRASWESESDRAESCAVDASKPTNEITTLSIRSVFTCHQTRGFIERWIVVMMARWHVSVVCVWIVAVENHRGHDGGIRLKERWLMRNNITTWRSELHRVLLHLSYHWAARSCLLNVGSSSLLYHSSTWLKNERDLPLTLERQEISVTSLHINRRTCSNRRHGLWRILMRLEIERSMHVINHFIKVPAG